MGINLKNKKVFFIALIFLLSVVSFFIFYLIVNADTSSNKVAIKNAKITKIDTGTNKFTTDGLDYSNFDSYKQIDGYIQGMDANIDNRIVRSFDEITYHFSFSISGKNDNDDYEQRKVNIKVTLPDDISKYVTFSKDSKSETNSHIFTFDEIDSYGLFEKDITLYVLGAPNKTLINPKFEISESTNSEDEYVVTLGNTDFSSNEYKYAYDKDLENKYTSESEFANIMPTVVSSKDASVSFKLLPSLNEGESASYNNSKGRYLTSVLSIELIGDEETGIKGYTMLDKSDITFKINSNKNSIIENGWVRNYTSAALNDINSELFSLPYSISNAPSSTKFPGNIVYANQNATISNYDFAYEPVLLNADNTNIESNRYIIGTYAITLFSPRSTEDGKNDIITTLTLSDIKLKDILSKEITVNDVSIDLVNKYYETSDYSLTSEFISSESNKILSISKGSNIKYKTTFKYNSISNQGLKEIIKIDTNAFRVVPIDDKNDINIIVNGSKLSKDDFEIKYISSDYNNKNYQVNNAFNRISSSDLSLVTNSCSNINLSNLSYNQVMNLYGGPCISAKENTELVFDKIKDAKVVNGNSVDEVPITKIIIQTKKGIILDDNTTVEVEVAIRVKNVSDLTQTYQIVTTSSSSDYDESLIYYSPRITNDEKSITNVNNYKKTIYKGNTISFADVDSTWGSSLKIVNFTSRQELSVTNKNSDGTIKTNYDVTKAEVITYNIKTNINDNNILVFADDVWYINNLKVMVTLPNTLTYVEDKSLGVPKVINNEDGSTVLIYELPYTKPNISIDDINFKCIIKSDLKGNSVPIEVTSSAMAVNINGETDTSYFDEMISKFTIYATGNKNIVLKQKSKENTSLMDKNDEFTYLISAYNNTDENITDYNIMSILPNNNDLNGSSFSGTYDVKVTLPSTLEGAKLYCTNLEYNKLKSDVFTKENDFKECNIGEYVHASAIKITNIPINSNSSTLDIEVTLKFKDNNYSDKYINSFIGSSSNNSIVESNKVEAKVVSRSISGKIFLDNNENGIYDKGDTIMENLPVTLYKINDNQNEEQIEETLSNSDGYYEFKELDIGNYKIKINYDKDKYDLTLRYACEDTKIDSDAYKIEEGKAEISNTKEGILNSTFGIKLTKEINKVSNLNMGLIPRRTFGFEINKYITKIDLTYNSILEENEYKNKKLVKLDVRNSLNANIKVYYGIQITNDSLAAGYVKLINESIPTGTVFDEKDPINKDWFYTNGEVQSVALENDLIAPGETRNLQIALNIPPQTEYRNYINTVTLLEIEKYEKDNLPNDVNATSNLYTLGEALTYAGENWHVINIENNESEQILTLLADSSNDNKKMGHTSSSSNTYKWSESLINTYINNDYVSTNSLNTPILIDNIICDDASGLSVASFGGTLKNEGKCQSGIYKDYKVRLLTENEYNKLLNSNLSDLSWLYGNGDFWLENSVYVNQNINVYGNVQDETIVKNLAKYVDKSSTSIKDGYDIDTSKWVYSSSKKEVRPVITISNKNIIAE